MSVLALFLSGALVVFLLAARACRRPSFIAQQRRESAAPAPDPGADRHQRELWVASRLPWLREEWHKYLARCAVAEVEPVADDFFHYCRLRWAAEQDFTPMPHALRAALTGRGLPRRLVV